MIINLTPHPITIVRDEPRSEDGYHVIAQIPGTDFPARCAENWEDRGHHAFIGGIEEIPLGAMTYGQVTGLPDPVEGTWYIVSQMVAAAAPDRDDLVFPAQMMRNEVGQIIGCRALAQRA